MSSVDLQIGLTTRIASGCRISPPSQLRPSYQDDLLIQRIYQIDCGYEDGNDLNHLRDDTMFKLVPARLPFDHGATLTSDATISRFEHAAMHQNIYHASKALIELFIASFASQPKRLILDLDHSEGACHGQQPLD